MSKEKSTKKDRLFYNQKNGYDIIEKDEALLVEEYAKGYMSFLDEAPSVKLFQLPLGLRKKQALRPMKPAWSLRPEIRSMFQTVVRP